MFKTLEAKNLQDGLRCLLRIQQIQMVGAWGVGVGCGKWIGNLKVYIIIEELNIVCNFLAC